MTAFKYEPTEKEFQRQVVDAARTCGFTHVYHTLRSKGSAPGFPDLVLVHPGRGVVVFAELKSEKGMTSSAQEGWLVALEKVADRNPGVIVRMWKPSMWDDILFVLTGRRQAAA